jgi:hypothetical protein
MTYRILLALTILSFIVWMGIQAGKHKNYFKLWTDFLSRQFLAIFRPVNSDGNRASLSVLSRFRAALLGLTGWLFALMALSSFIPVLVAGSPLSGWMLILHVTVAPFFLIALAMTALLFAVNKLFKPEDLHVLTSLKSDREAPVLMPFLSRLSFWTFLVVAIPAVLSVILSMYPLFTAEGLEALVRVHRYATLILFIIVGVYAGNKIKN